MVFASLIYGNSVRKRVPSLIETKQFEHNLKLELISDIIGKFLHCVTIFVSVSHLFTTMTTALPSS